MRLIENGNKDKQIEESRQLLGIQLPGRGENGFSQYKESL